MKEIDQLMRSHRKGDHEKICVDVKLGCSQGWPNP